MSLKETGYPFTLIQDVTNWADENYKALIETLKDYAEQTLNGKIDVAEVCSYFQDKLDYIKSNYQRFIDTATPETFSDETDAKTRAAEHLNSFIEYVTECLKLSKLKTPVTQYREKEQIQVVVSFAETLKTEITNTVQTQQTASYIQRLIDEGFIDEKKNCLKGLEPVAQDIKANEKMITAQTLRQFINPTTGKPYSGKSINQAVSMANA